MRRRKEQELEFYTQRLHELQEKIKALRMDIDLTARIIAMIKQEKVLEIKRK